MGGEGSFSAFGTWVGHFFINFHGGTRTMPRPTRPTTRRKQNCWSGESEKKFLQLGPKLWVCFVQMSEGGDAFLVRFALHLCGCISTALSVCMCVCVCVWVDYFQFRCPSKSPPCQNPPPTEQPFEKGLVKAKTHFYVCSPARRLAVLILFPFFLSLAGCEALFCPQPLPKIWRKEWREGWMGCLPGRDNRPSPIDVWSWSWKNCNFLGGKKPRQRLGVALT